MIRPLVSHSTSSVSSLVWQVESKTESCELTFDIVYRVRGDLSNLVIPNPCTMPSREDNLWQDTCFEVFLRQTNQTQQYLEFNFSPAGHWAFYRFRDYRVDLERPPAHEPPTITTQIRGDDLFLVAKIPWSMIHDTLPGNLPLEIGLSVILKDRNGEISYWAIMHPSDKPDFHHPDSFVAL